MYRKLFSIITLVVTAFVLVIGVNTLLALAGSLNSAGANGSTLYVDDDTCPDTGSGTEASPYCRVQTAVDAADTGDEIHVAAGLYTGTETVLDERTGYTYTQVVFITRSLTLRGGYDAGNWDADPDPIANPTVIDAQRQGRGVSLVGASSDRPVVTLDGFTLTGGDYTGLGNPPGVGYRVCRATGVDCGGGLYATYTTLILRNSIISDNVASRNAGRGGGIYLWEVPYGTASRIENTTIISNSGESGGGMHVTELNHPFTITRSTFRENRAGELGGGLSMYSNIEALVTIAETDFISNTAQTVWGGGAYVNVAGDGERLRMDRVRLLGNEAGEHGAALYLRQVGSWPSSARLTNLLLADNRSTSGNPTASVINVSNLGIRFDVTLAHLTSASNPAPAFLRAVAPSDPEEWLSITLTNTLVTSATYAFVGLQPEGDGDLLIRHTKTLTDGVTTLHHAEAGSPTFQPIEPLSGDARLDSSYRLRLGSDAIDAGAEAGVTVDIDGDSRIEYAPPDIGADEFTIHSVHLPAVWRGP